MNLNVMLDRRNFLGMFGAAAGVAVLAGCGGASSAGSNGSSGAQKGDASAAGYTLVTAGKITCLLYTSPSPRDCS